MKWFLPHWKVGQKKIVNTAWAHDAGQRQKKPTPIIHQGWMSDIHWIQRIYIVHLF